MRSNKRKKIIILLIGGFVISAIIFLRLQRPFQANVLLISIDALRPDHMSCYGYKRKTTPFLDNFTKNATVFTQAVSHSSHTPVSFGSIATGTYFSRHYLQGWGYTLNPLLPTIAEVLKKNGYKTIFISSSSHFQNLYGFDRGFDIFLPEDIPEDMMIPHTISHLKNLKDKKFFLWMHYMGVHDPRFALKEDMETFLEDKFYNSHNRLPIVEESLDFYGFKGIPKCVVVKGIDNLDFYIAQYDASIRTLDRQLNILFEKLKELKLYKKTIIIITADHGELLGEHGYYFHHGWFLYEPLIKIPLIIKGHGIPKKKVAKQQVEASVDIVPTIIDMLGIKTNLHFDGKSLTSSILNKWENSKGFAICDEGYSNMAIRTPIWKLIQFKDKKGKKSYELYNLKEDPGESFNVAVKNKEIFCLLKERLNDYSEQCEHRGKKRIKSLDRNAIEKLKSLGYLQ